MDSDKYDVIYCPENRVYCNICDKSCIERFYKTHLKSQTHTKNTYKRQQINMQFKCDLFDRDRQNLSRNIHIKSLIHKKCLREKYIINNPNFFEVDQILNNYVEGYDKKFARYLINFEFKLK